MHDATKTNPIAPHKAGQAGQEIRMVGSQSLRQATPGRVGRDASLAYVSDVVSILKRKRDRYKGRDKMIQAKAVQACIDELRGVWK